MGTTPSISKEELLNYDCQQIAEVVTSLGAAYLIYKECILSNAVAGDVLSEFNDRDEFNEFLEEIGISNKAHKRILSIHYKKLFLTPTVTTSTPASVVSVPRQNSHSVDNRPRSLPHLVFLTHDWGKDELDRQNHERVKKVNQILQAEGIKTWFDEERLQGNIRYQMAEGIENSYAMVVFVTRRYMEKVNSLDNRDNCKVRDSPVHKFSLIFDLLVRV